MNTEDLKTVGGRIRAVRKARGLSGKELADKAGVSETTVSRCERGEQSLTLDNAARLSFALDVSIDWIQNGDGVVPMGTGESTQVFPVFLHDLKEALEWDVIDDNAREEKKRRRTKPETSHDLI